MSSITVGFATNAHVHLSHAYNVISPHTNIHVFVIYLLFMEMRKLLKSSYYVTTTRIHGMLHSPIRMLMSMWMRQILKIQDMDVMSVDSVSII